MSAEFLLLLLKQPYLQKSPSRRHPHMSVPSRSWGVGEDCQVDIHDVHIHYKDPQLNLSVVIHHLHVDPAESWFPERQTPFDIDMEINGGKFLFQGTVRPFRNPPDLTVHLQMVGFPLGWLAPLVHYPGFDGKVSGKLYYRRAS